MANKTIQVSRNQTLYSSKVSAKSALKRLMQSDDAPKDGEIKCVRYTDEDGYERTLLGAYKMNDSGISYVAIFEPEEVKISPNQITFTVSNDTDGKNVTLHAYTQQDGSTYETVEVTENGTYTITDKAGNGDDKSTKTVSTLGYGFKVISNQSYITVFDFSGWDSSYVSNMGYMFYGCSALASLDLSNFDTSNATTMSYMFSDCSALASLDLSNWDVSKVTDMGGMFKNCSSLTTIYVDNCSDATIEKLINRLSTDGFTFTEGEVEGRKALVKS